MNATATATVSSSKTLLTDGERVLLALPAITGLVLGFVLVFLPNVFAAVAQFPPDDAYIYQLGGAATLGYGIGFSVAAFQRSWRTVRLPVIGLLVFQLGSLYACLVDIVTGHPPYSVYLITVSSLLFIAISVLLLSRHRGTPQPAQDLANPLLRVFLIIGAVAAGVFGLLPLFVPRLFTLFHLQINAPFIIRQAGAASLGYAVVAVLVLTQRALNRQELQLPTVMAAIFNGVGGLVSIPYILAGNILLLPLLIAPVGLIVLVICVILIRQMMLSTARSSL